MQSRPGWQADECPSWCVGEHGEHDHPDDRVHRSVSLAVPVVARRTWLEGGGIRRSSDTEDFEVGLSRVDGESETWLYVGAGPGSSIDVAVESAHRLVAALESVLRSR